MLEDLQTLRAVTCYIALMPARRHLSDDDFVSFARLAEVLTFRYSSVVGLGTNELERRYHDAARTLNDSGGAAVDKARAILGSAMPDSQQFRASFERLTLGRQYLLRYALARIEETLSPDKEKQVKKSGVVHIEHVMPQKLSPAWMADLGEGAKLHAECVNRWGNLTLLFGKLNIPASNKAFEEKKPHYLQSQIAMTVALCDRESWGPAEIADRQRNLAALADEIWPVPSGALPSSATPGARDRFLIGLAILGRRGALSPGDRAVGGVRAGPGHQSPQASGQCRAGCDDRRVAVDAARWLGGVRRRGQERGAGRCCVLRRS